LFDLHPLAAAVALPYVEPVQEGRRKVMSPVADGSALRQFVGCAHAIRRQTALEFGGYPEFLVHQGEERDLCIRLLDAGHQIIAANTPPVVHMVSPQRDAARLSYYGYRNTLLFHWMRTPQPYLFPRMVVDSLQLARHKFSWRSLPARAAAVAAGWCGCVAYWRERRPVKGETYRRYRALLHHGPLAYLEQLPGPAGSTLDRGGDQRASREPVGVETPPLQLAPLAKALERDV
jgi:GT2 family glycosyltransferase